jgi:hypothetical protein
MSPASQMFAGRPRRRCHPSQCVTEGPNANCRLYQVAPASGAPDDTTIEYVRPVGRLEARLTGQYHRDPRLGPKSPRTWEFKKKDGAGW